MNIRTKLLFAFLSISFLIIIVGIIFYTQLNNLIIPLTPQSIPHSMDKLTDDFNKNNYIFNMSEQQLLMQNNLEYYIFTGQLHALKNYYLHKGFLSNLLQNSNYQNNDIAKKLFDPILLLEKIQTTIINSQKEDAIKLLTEKNYEENLNKVRSNIENEHYNITGSSYEDANITIKLVEKNLKNILKHNLNITLVIFLDAVIISFLFAFIAARMISEPLNKLRFNIDRMRKSNMYVPFDNKLLTSKGEIGELARSFSELINNLRATTVWKDELLQEIERRKQFEESLKETALRLQKSNKELDQFAYMASHDLRSPLRGIESLVNWIKEDYFSTLPDEAKHYFELIKKRTQRLEFLINGILEYSRAGRIESQLSKVDVSELVFEVVEALHNPEHIKFSLDTPLPTLVTNKIALTQVFLNLLSNAIKHNDKEEGQINIGCNYEENYFQFYVADNGPGISAEFYDKIFQIFETLQTRDTIEGSGVGLAIVKKIVENQGGKVWIESEKGKGSIFYFTWPSATTD